MILLRDSSALPDSCKQAVLALGNFDGLHLGHRAILQETLTRARATGRPAGVMTFEPHPRRVFQPELPPLRIFPFSEKVRLLKELGMDFIRIVRFTRDFSQTTADQFITRILHEQMQVSQVVTGEDFTFGYQRGGNAAYLQEKARILGFAATACSPVLLHGERCSSTRVRGLLAEGNMEEVTALLNRPYSITGIVRHGDKRGRELGFPTANILPTRIFVPASGVYAVRAVIDGQTVIGAAHLGPRPVFDSAEIRLETHFLDWQGDLYGKKMRVELAGLIRGERVISDIGDLKRQITEDCLIAHRVLST